MAEARYRLRFFFDAGSGACLWSGSDATRERFGYPVALELLPVSEHVRRAALQLCAWYDTSLDWESPSRPSPWSSGERQRFRDAALSFVAAARLELGDEFRVVDEFTPNDARASG